MPELSFLRHIAQTFYGLEPQSMEALEPYFSEQRGIYRLQDTQGGVWIFWLLRSTDRNESLIHVSQRHHRGLYPISPEEANRLNSG